MRRKNRCNTTVILLCLAAITGLVTLFFCQRAQLHTEKTDLHGGEHILMLLPSLEAQTEQFSEAAQKIADAYDLRIECMSLSTVASQRQMLSLVPLSDIDAVLLWAVSSVDEDYAAELRACRESGIPVVLIGHDLPDKSLRSSFIGSGMNSELMVISQTLWLTDKDLPILIGTYSHAGSGEIYELLIMEKTPNPDFDATQIWGDRLKAFVDTPPNDYHAGRYFQVSATSQGTAALNLELIRTLRDMEPLGLVFSLDETLTLSLAVDIEVGELEKEHLGIVIGYGSGSKLERHVDSGVIDELIVSDVLYSSVIGLRYLHDILRGLWVPSTLDSGVQLIT